LVRPKRRREGFGSMLIQKMKRLHPDASYEPSHKTELGSLFVHKDVDLQEQISRIKSIISEIADDVSNIYPFQLQPKDGDPAERYDKYTFTTESKEYIVKFPPINSSSYPEGSYYREYKTIDMTYLNAFSMTNENKAIKVNATIMSITIDWLNRHEDFFQLFIHPVDERRYEIVKRFIDNTILGKYNVLYNEGNIVIRNLK
jgi:hypothetical protein